jgi:tetratricopeptide (TPR) repeat protein
MRHLIRLAILLLSTSSLLAQHGAHGAGDAPAIADVGAVSFANSGAPAAQEPFTRGLALLHNFEYAQSAEAFRAAQGIDPAFAMAYWGEAMTYTHPVWFQQDLDAARSALQRLAPTAAARRELAKTDRERAYMDAIEILYGEGTKQERDFRFSDALAALHARFPADVDATAFYALSLLGTAHQGRDFAIYMRAAALLEEVFPANQRHPGVLHYLIHSYDDPVHAPLGMRAARLYGGVAPNAGHALHMTSHIFVALGLWDDVLDANRRAIDVVNRARAAKGKQRGDCGHYPTWLHYALLQKGDMAAARQALDACRASAFENAFVAAGPVDTQAGRMAEYATMRAHQLTSGGTLAEADNVSFPDAATAGVRFTIAYGDALAAARRGDTKALAAAATRVRALQSDAAAEIGKDMPPGERMRLDVILQQVDALELLAAGKRAPALALLRRAVAAEEAMPLDFGPPAVEQPSLELLGETLLGAGQDAEAAEAFRGALARTPGRAVTAAGLRRAESVTH